MRCRLPLLYSVIGLLVLGLLAAGAPAAVASGSGDSGTVEPVHGVSTTWPVEVAGVGMLLAGTGAAGLDPSGAWSGIRLEADAVRIAMDWERGVWVDPFVGIVVERGEQVVDMEDATVRFDEFQGEPLVFVLAEGADVELGFSFAQGVSLLPDEDLSVVSVGSSPGGFGAGDMDAGFWYSIDEPVIVGEGHGALSVRGDFALFVHDVWIHAEGPDEQWSDWTGHWEDTPELPGREYEMRVTMIHVENGTFTGSSREPVGLYLPQVEAHVEDVVMSAPSVTGRLLRGSELFVFDQDPMSLQGTGNVSFAANAKHGFAGMDVRPSGDFAVRGASTVETVEGASPEGTGGSPYPVAGIMLAALATVGLIGMGVVPIPTVASRRMRYARWMRFGQSAADSQRLSRAAWCYERATRVKPDEPIAWFEWAQTELEAGHPEKTEQIAKRALVVPGMDRLDILELRAAAAWQRGDRDAFNEHLGELAGEAPAMARRLMEDYEIDPQMLAPQVRHFVDRSGGQEGIDGYV